MSLRLAFYGESLSELLEILEQLARAGVKTQLCLASPTSLPADLEAIGLLCAHPTALLPLRATIHHALTAPQALGAALEGSVDSLSLGTSAIPVVFGAPEQGRYVAFRGLHTQLYPEALWAIARQETDLAVALHQQTERFSLYDINCLYLDAGREAVRTRLREIQADPDPSVVFFDSLSAAHTALIGELLWERKPPLVAGSAAVESALLAAWKTARLLPESVTLSKPERVEQLFVVSGAPPEQLAPQLTWARSQGFFCHTFREAGRAHKVITGALSVGHSVVLYAGSPAPTETELTQTLRTVLKTQKVKRLVIYGESLCRSLVASLAFDALEWVAPLLPGAPLCRLIGGPFAGTELVLCATPPEQADFLASVRAGTQS